MDRRRSRGSAGQRRRGTQCTKSRRRRCRRYEWPGGWARRWKARCWRPRGGISGPRETRETARRMRGGQPCGRRCRRGRQRAEWRRLRRVGRVDRTGGREGRDLRILVGRCLLCDLIFLLGSRPLLLAARVVVVAYMRPGLTPEQFLVESHPEPCQLLCSSRSPSGPRRSRQSFRPWPCPPFPPSPFGRRWELLRPIPPKGRRPGHRSAWEEPTGGPAEDGPGRRRGTPRGCRPRCERWHRRCRGLVSSPAAASGMGQHAAYAPVVRRAQRGRKSGGGGAARGTWPERLPAQWRRGRCCGRGG